jgi:hypothetical protein
MPKKNGGLGMLNLRKQNQALLIIFLFKFFNKKDIPWVKLLWEAYYSDGKIPQEKCSKGSFWWKDCTELIGMFKSIAAPQVKSGNSTLLWNDKWLDECPKLKYPQLHSFAKNTDLSISHAKGYSESNIFDMFHLPLSTIAHDQCHELVSAMEPINMNLGNDIWNLTWGGGGKYSTKKVYESISEFPEASSPFKWIWKSCCLSKQKFFFWLLLLDRLNTKDLMTRKHFYVEDSCCVICDDEPNESLLHLFFACDFS